MKKVNLRLGKRSYKIVMGKNLLPSLGRLVKPLGLGSKVLIATNRRVAGLFLGRVRTTLSRSGYEVVTPYFLPQGDERDKSEKVLSGLWRHMAKCALERSSTVLALGGGVVGDLAGFAAATYMRGISLLQVPTTLLAQVDASVGGKTAIDLPSAKNIVGAFYQPRMVIADLETLGKMGLTPTGLRQLRNSFAEVIKYGVIQDPELFRLLERKIDGFFSAASRRPLGNQEYAFLEEVVCRSVSVKAKVVEADERETTGRRMILNFGHTFAHALEAASNFRLAHGEAVALGMRCASRLAVERGIFGGGDELRLDWLIQKTGLPTRINGRGLDPRRVIRPMLLDKKKKEGRLRLVLPVAIGRVQVVDNVTPSEIKGVLSDLGGN
jgi:3-dehydroquinate synthase